MTNTNPIAHTKNKRYNHSMQSIPFYQNHLNKVSRSFAFCIARLKNDMRLWVSLSYLLCRVLDTVEDAPWSSSAEQEQAFKTLTNFITSTPDPLAVDEWTKRFPKNIPTGEQELLLDTNLLFADLHALPQNITQKIQRSVLNMLRGMQHFTHHTGEEKIRLQNLTEVNQYCFFVAGLVGELLTDLALEKFPSSEDHKTLYLKARHFGLFLQKINLLKDQKEDEREGRFLIHSRTEVLASLEKDAQNAIQYILSLPVTEKGYRLFCAWSLFLGLGSLPWIQKSWAIGILKKIPRIITQKLLARVETCIDDNRELLQLFRERLPRLPQLLLSPEKPMSIDWFFKIYAGALSLEEMAELGMVGVSS